MVTLTLILVFFYIITGRDPKELMAKLKDIDWNGLYIKLKNKLKSYARKVGRVASKPILILYYVLSDESLSLQDKVMIYGCLIYVISPASLISIKISKIFGIIDEATAIIIVIKKIYNRITPEIISKAETTLSEWFDEPVGVVNV
jgi:uncharacterized membrane protein YkvA (DUF1232 family)